MLLQIPLNISRTNDAVASINKCVVVPGNFLSGYCALVLATQLFHILHYYLSLSSQFCVQFTRKMSSSETQSNPAKVEAGVNNGSDSNTLTQQQTNQSTHVDYGHYGPLAHVNTAGTLLPPFGGEFQPGAYRPGPVEKRKIANPAPLGLCGFALTTFVLGCINMQTRGITQPNMFVGTAYAYGGLVQLLAGMWYV